MIREQENEKKMVELGRMEDVGGETKGDGGMMREDKWKGTMEEEKKS